MYLFSSILFNVRLHYRQIHGGTREKDIIDFVAEAEGVARASRINRETEEVAKASGKKKVMDEDNKKKEMDTVVFFDEANTTDAIGLIKEIMCDRRIHGKPILENLKFIAACNPYRRYVQLIII